MTPQILFLTLHFYSLGMSTSSDLIHPMTIVDLRLRRGLVYVLSSLGIFPKSCAIFFILFFQLLRCPYLSLAFHLFSGMATIKPACHEKLKCFIFPTKNIYLLFANTMVCARVS